MLRRDYILRMIEEFFQLLARVNEQKRRGAWSEAEVDLEREAMRLTGAGLDTICSLTDTELFARLLQTGEYQAQSEKSLMLARVLAEAAELAEAQGRRSTIRALRLRSLHLLLHTALRGDVFEWPEFAPRLDMLLQRFDELPLHTEGLLMQHFERTGQFARAEDAFYSMLEVAPANPELLQLGISFYHRLLTRDDAALVSGNLPRDEVEAGLKLLESRNARK